MSAVEKGRVLHGLAMECIDRIADGTTGISENVHQQAGMILAVVQLMAARLLHDTGLPMESFVAELEATVATMASARARTVGAS